MYAIVTVVLMVGGACACGQRRVQKAIEQQRTCMHEVTGSTCLRHSIELHLTSAQGIHLILRQQYRYRSRVHLASAHCLTTAFDSREEDDCTTVHGDLVVNTLVYSIKYLTSEVFLQSLKTHSSVISIYTTEHIYLILHPSPCAESKSRNMSR